MFQAFLNVMFFFTVLAFLCVPRTVFATNVVAAAPPKPVTNVDADPDIAALRTGNVGSSLSSAVKNEPATAEEELAAAAQAAIPISVPIEVEQKDVVVPEISAEELEQNEELQKLKKIVDDHAANLPEEAPIPDYMRRAAAERADVEDSGFRSMAVPDHGTNSGSTSSSFNALHILGDLSEHEEHLSYHHQQTQKDKPIKHQSSAFANLDKAHETVVAYNEETLPVATAAKNTTESGTQTAYDNIPRNAKGEVEFPATQIWTDQLTPLYLPMEQLEYAQLGLCDAFPAHKTRHGKASKTKDHIFHDQPHSLFGPGHYDLMHGLNVTHRIVCSQTLDKTTAEALQLAVESEYWVRFFAGEEDVEMNFFLGAAKTGGLRDRQSLEEFMVKHNGHTDQALAAIPQHLVRSKDTVNEPTTATQTDLDFVNVDADKHYFMYTHRVFIIYYDPVTHSVYDAEISALSPQLICTGCQIDFHYSTLWVPMELAQFQADVLHVASKDKAEQLEAMPENSYQHQRHHQRVDAALHHKHEAIHGNEAEHLTANSYHLLTTVLLFCSLLILMLPLIIGGLPSEQELKFQEEVFASGSIWDAYQLSKMLGLSNADTGYGWYLRMLVVNVYPSLNFMSNDKAFKHLKQLDNKRLTTVALEKADEDIKAKKQEFLDRNNLLSNDSMVGGSSSISKKPRRKTASPSRNLLFRSFTKFMLCFGIEIFAFLQFFCIAHFMDLLANDSFHTGEMQFFASRIAVDGMMYVLPLAAFVNGLVKVTLEERLWKHASKAGKSVGGTNVATPMTAISNTDGIVLGDMTASSNSPSSSTASCREKFMSATGVSHVVIFSLLLLTILETATSLPQTTCGLILVLHAVAMFLGIAFGTVCLRFFGLSHLAATVQNSVNLFSNSPTGMSGANYFTLPTSMVSGSTSSTSHVRWTSTASRTVQGLLSLARQDLNELIWNTDKKQRIFSVVHAVFLFVYFVTLLEGLIKPEIFYALTMPGYNYGFGGIAAAFGLFLAFASLLGALNIVISAVNKHWSITQWIFESSYIFGFLLNVYCLHTFGSTLKWLNWFYYSFYLGLSWLFFTILLGSMTFGLTYFGSAVLIHSICLPIREKKDA